MMLKIASPHLIVKANLTDSLTLVPPAGIFKLKYNVVPQYSSPLLLRAHKQFSVAFLAVFFPAGVARFVLFYESRLARK